MSTIIAFVLILVAGAMWLKKPLNISLTINHKYEPTQVQPIPEIKDDIDKNQAPHTMDAVLKNINELMLGDDVFGNDTN